MNFISPKTDFAFKKIFGSTDSQDILISLLNALIYNTNPVIQDLEIIDPYHPGDGVDRKDSYLIVVELPKFTKTLDELDSLTDKWIYFIKEAANLDVIPPAFRQVPELDKAMNMANQANLTVEEVEELRQRELFLEAQQ